MVSTGCLRFSLRSVVDRPATLKVDQSIRCQRNVAQRSLTQATVLPKMKSDILERAPINGTRLLSFGESGSGKVKQIRNCSECAGTAASLARQI